MVFFLIELNPSCRFPRSVRLLNRVEYQQVFADPVRSSDDLFTVLACRNSRETARLGLAIAKKTIARAVQRNRIKRLVRESFRANQAQLLGIDAVVLAKKGLQDRSNNEIQRSLSKHWDRLVIKCAQS
jgi:ribonuclease P protein component